MNDSRSHRNPIEELADDFMRRQREGKSPTIDEYTSRYPELAEEIRDVFPMLIVMEDVRDGVAKDEGGDRLTAGSPTQIGAKIGDYRITRMIGRGGMGVVFEAEQESLGRRVALKTLSSELLQSPKYLARFHREARAAANLQHANIVPVFGVGEESGVHYYVMQYINGRGMDEVMTAIRRIPVGFVNEVKDPTESAAASSNADDSALDDTVVGSDWNFGDATHLLSAIESPADDSRGGSSKYFERVAELGALAADALAYAHHQGVLHRDIKPSNLLLDVTGNLWVTDFGLAKIEGEQDLTATGDIIGTLRYLAPECLHGHFDNRGDIYGLGLTLYELVTRSQAFDSSDRGELLRRIADEGPPSIARQSGVPRDLETVIHKAIERSPKDRYARAEDLADDLRRFTRHEPVRARRISVPAKLSRWATRNRALATVSALLLVGLLVGLVASLVVSGRLLRLTGELAAALQDSRQQNYVGDIGLAFESIQRGDLARARTLLREHLPGPGEQDDLRGFEWRYLWSRSQATYTADLGRYHTFLSGVAVSPDGQFAALNREDPWRVDVVNLRSGAVEKSLAMPRPVSHLTYSPSGKLLVGHHQGKVWGWDTESWESREPLDLSFPLAFGHDRENEIFVACRRNQESERMGRVVIDQLSLWDATRWQKIGDLANLPRFANLLEPGYGEAPGHMMNSLAVSADDRYVYLAGKTGIRRWDCHERKELTTFHLQPSGSPAFGQWGEGLACLAASPQGEVAVGDRWGNVHLLDPETGKVRHTFESHIGWVSCLKFSRDGTRLVSGGGDRKIVLHDPLALSTVQRLLAHATQVWAVDISDDGGTVVSGSGNGGRVLTWSLADPSSHELVGAGITHFAMMDDSRVFFLRGSEKDAELYDPVEGTLEPAGVEGFVRLLRTRRTMPRAISPHGKWAVTKEANTLVVWDLASATRLQKLVHDSGEIADGGFPSVVFSPNSRYLVTSGRDSEARLWNTDNWTSTVLFPPVSRTLGISFSGNSQYLAVSDESKDDNNHEVFHVRVFDLADGTKMLLNKKNPVRVWSVALSMDGRLLAFGPQDQTIRIWDMRHNKEASTLRGQTNSAFSLSFSPDDLTLASANFATVKLWSVATGEELISVKADAKPVQFSPNGQYAAAIVFHSASDVFSGKAAGLRFWKAPTIHSIDADLANRSDQHR